MTGNTAKDPTHRVHQSAAGVWPLGDLHRQGASSPIHPSHPQASVIGTNQAASESSLNPGLYAFQNQDQHVASLSTGDYSHSVPSGYNQLVDFSLQLSNLSTQSLNNVFRGENLDLTDATPAFKSGSKVPRHSVIGQFEIDSGQLEMSTLLDLSKSKNVWPSGLTNHPSVSPDHKIHQDTPGLEFDVCMKAQNLKKRLDLAFSLFGSPEDGSRLNSKGTRGGLPEYGPPLFPSQAKQSPGKLGEDENYPPAQNIPVTLQSKLDALRPVSPKQGFSARRQSEQNLESLGSAEWRNTGTLNSKVHNVRVKPQSKFISSAYPLSWKPSVQPLKLKPTVSTSQEQMVDQSPLSTHLYPNQQTHLHNLINPPPNHPVAGPGYDRSLGSAFALRSPVQAAGKTGKALV